MKKIIFLFLTSFLLGNVFAAADPQGVLKIDKITVKCGDEMDGKDLSSILTGVDVAGFKLLGGGYGKSKTEVYYGCKKVEGADIATFKNIGKNYAKDKYLVYFDGEVIPNSDPKTFSMIYGTWLSKDKNHVYQEGKILEGADAKTFVILSMAYAKDKNYVYLENGNGFKVVKGANPKTFKIPKK